MAHAAAISPAMSRSRSTTRRQNATTYVPGPGALAKEADFDRCIAMIDERALTAWYRELGTR
jgi:hypothetical protein